VSKTVGPTIAAWDGKAALRAAGGDPSFLAELVNIYLKDAARGIARIRRLERQERFEDIGNEAHRLKGASLTLRLDGLGAACRDIEEAARMKSAPLVAERTALFKTGLEAFSRYWAGRVSA
jgi:HPt (histidine-containing phosphotransfer) domain-containing protein